ncbi:MAG: GWxTD domain-containing protein [bacterium]
MKMETTDCCSHTTVSINDRIEIKGITMLLVRIAAVILIGCGLAGSVSTETAASDIDSQLTIYAGVITYPNPDYDSLTLVEISFSLNRHQLTFYRQDSSQSDLYAYIHARLDFYDTTGAEVDSVSTFFSVRVDSREEAAQPGYRVFNRLVRFFRPGRYSAHLTVTNVADDRRGEVALDDFDVEPADTERLTLGGVSLAYNVDFVGDDYLGTNARLIKNGYLVIQNPAALYSPEEDTVAWVYGELYNLDYAPENPSSYELSYAVLNSDSSLYLNLGSVAVVKPGRTAVITESIDIVGWPAGRYYLRLAARDQTTGETDTTLVSFIILLSREAMLASLKPHSSDPYDTLSLEVKIQLATHFLTPEEKITLKRLTNLGKVNFLKQFWRERDETPATDINEYRLELIERFEYCNRRFSNYEDRSDGWSTDRGRIYIVYGPWEEIEDKQSPLVDDAYQIWYYHSLREGKYFVFQDITGSFDYRLVHSNVYGEIYSRGWQDIIDRGLESDRPLDY